MERSKIVVVNFMAPWRARPDLLPQIVTFEGGHGAHKVVLWKSWRFCEVTPTIILAQRLPSVSVPSSLACGHIHGALASLRVCVTNVYILRAGVIGASG